MLGTAEGGLNIYRDGICAVSLVNTSTLELVLMNGVVWWQHNGDCWWNSDKWVSSRLDSAIICQLHSLSHGNIFCNMNTEFMQKNPKSPVWQRQLPEQEATGLKAQKRTTAVSRGIADLKEWPSKERDGFSFYTCIYQGSRASEISIYSSVFR